MVAGYGRGVANPSFAGSNQNFYPGEAPPDTTRPPPQYSSGTYEARGFSQGGDRFRANNQEEPRSNGSGYGSAFSQRGSEEQSVPNTNNAGFFRQPNRPQSDANSGSVGGGSFGRGTGFKSGQSEYRDWDRFPAGGGGAFATRAPQGGMPDRGENRTDRSGEYGGRGAFQPSFGQSRSNFSDSSTRNRDEGSGFQQDGGRNEGRGFRSGNGFRGPEGQGGFQSGTTGFGGGSGRGSDFSRSSDNRGSSGGEGGRGFRSEGRSEFGGGSTEGNRGFGGNQEGGGSRGFGGNQESGGTRGFGGGELRGFGGGHGIEDGAERGSAPATYVPVNRDLDEIYREDEANAASMLTDDLDLPVQVTGVPGAESVRRLEHWDNAGFEPLLLKNIEKCKYRLPRRIQSAVIPLVCEGWDLFGHAETGGGKTAAFVLPIINHVMKNRLGGNEYRCCPIALTVAPTRELIVQLYDQARKLAAGTGVSVAKAYGQYRVMENYREICEGCNLLFATPGRLADFIKRGYIKVDKIQFLVLDEADRLLDDNNFQADMLSLCDTPEFPPKESRQTLLFSATLTETVQEFAQQILKKKYAVVSNGKRLAANKHVVQNFVQVNNTHEKLTVLSRMLLDEQTEKGKVDKTLVFVQKKSTADMVALYLSNNAVPACSINGDRTQEQREKALKEFRQGKTTVLVATDVCARGIDIGDLKHVVNMDLPNDGLTYVHRIGRTGRLSQGRATSFFDMGSDRSIAGDLLRIVREAEQVPPDFLVNIGDSQSSFGGGGGGFGSGGSGGGGFASGGSGGGGFASGGSGGGGFASGGSGGFASGGSGGGGFASGGSGGGGFGSGRNGGGGFASGGGGGGGFGNNRNDGGGGFSGGGNRGGRDGGFAREGGRGGGFGSGRGGSFGGGRGGGAGFSSDANGSGGGGFSNHRGGGRGGNTGRDGGGFGRGGADNTEGFGKKTTERNDDDGWQ